MEPRPFRRGNEEVHELVTTIAVFQWSLAHSGGVTHRDEYIYGMSQAFQWSLAHSGGVTSAAHSEHDGEPVVSMEPRPFGRGNLLTLTPEFITWMFQWSLAH